MANKGRQRVVVVDENDVAAGASGPTGSQTGANSQSVVAASDGLFVRITGNPGTFVDKSATITVGGVAQSAIAANTARNGYWIQNQSSGNLWISTLAAAIAGQPSLLIPPGALYETPLNGFGTGAVSIIGATTGQAFAAREW